MAEASPTTLSDYDIFSAQFRNCPYPTWAAMQRSCPVTHSDRLGGSWMVARYDDVRDLVRDNIRLSSRSTEVGGPRESSGGLLTPPITSAPPRHDLDRDRLMPFFHPKQIATLESDIRTLARSLVQPLAAAGRGGAATGFAPRRPDTVTPRRTSPSGSRSLCSPGTCSTCPRRCSRSSSTGRCGCCARARWTRPSAPPRCAK